MKKTSGSESLSSSLNFLAGRLSKIKIEWYLLIAAFLITILYVSLIPSSFFDGDEPEALSFARENSYGSIVLNPPKANPPFFYIVLKIITSFTSLVGASLFAVRFLLSLFYLGSMIITYKIVAGIFSRLSAFYASTLMLFSYFLIPHIGEISGYSMFLFFSMLTIKYTLDLVHGPAAHGPVISNSKKDAFLMLRFSLRSFLRSSLILFILFSIININTHYFGIVLLVAELIVLLFSRIKKSHLAIAFVVIVLFTLNVSLQTYAGFVHQKNLSWAAQPSPRDNMQMSYQELAMDSSSNIITSVVMQILLPLLLIYGIFTFGKKKELRILYLLGISMLLFFLMSFFIIIKPRHYIFLFPLVFIVLGLVLSGVASQMLKLKKSKKEVRSSKAVTTVASMIAGIFILMFALSGIIYTIDTRNSDWAMSQYYEQNIIKPVSNGLYGGNAIGVLTSTEQDFYILRYYFPNAIIFRADIISYEEFQSFCPKGCKLILTHDISCDVTSIIAQGNSKNFINTFKKCYNADYYDSIDELATHRVALVSLLRYSSG